METLYTPYGLVLNINYKPHTKFNEISLRVSVKNKNNFNIIKNNLLESYKTKNGTQKFAQKLRSYYVSEFKITEPGNGSILEIHIRVPLSYGHAQTYTKVIKIILRILLRSFPKRIENLFGIEKLLDLYNDLNINITLSGNFNVAAVFRMFRTASPYIGFKY